MHSKTFAEAAASYIEFGGEAKHLSRVLPHLGGQLLTSIVPFDVKQLALALYDKQTNATRNRQVIMPVRAVFYHAYERGWGPLIRLRNFKEDPPKRKKAATPAWLHAFVRQCAKDRLHHLAALVLFMAQTGARISEALRLQWAEVDLVSRKAVLLKTKTSVNSVRFLTDQLVGRLYDLKDKSDPAKPVFRYINRHSVNERIKAVCERAEIEYKPCHTCGRHAMANTAIALGVDIKSAMDAGGWKSVPVFLGIYVNPRNAGRLVAERMNTYQYDNDL